MNPHRLEYLFLHQIPGINIFRPVHVDGDGQGCAFPAFDVEMAGDGFAGQDGHLLQIATFLDGSVFMQGMTYTEDGSCGKDLSLEGGGGIKACGGGDGNSRTGMVRIGYIH